MTIKKVKRKCMMRGCKCVDCYSVSLTRELGNSIIICADCARKLHEAIEEQPAASAEKQAAPSAPPALFFGGAIKTAEAPAKEEPKEPKEAEKYYICGKCGKAFSDQKEYLLHQKSCGAAKKSGSTKKGGGKK